MNKYMEPAQPTISNEREKQRGILSLFLKNSEKGHSPYYTLKASRKRAVLTGKLFRKAYEKESIVAWRNSFVPTEIFYALDIIPFAAEGNCSMFANSGLATKPLNLSEENLYSRDTCSFLRCLAGTSILNCMPTPDFLVATSHYCDGASKVFYNLSRRYNKSFYLLDIPYCNYDKKESIDYVAGQIREIFEMLEKETGKKGGLDKLAEVISYSNQARSYFLKVNELRKNIPAPMLGGEGIDYVAVLSHIWGLPETVEIYKLWYEELIGRIDNNNSPLKMEKHRILWRNLRPYYTHSLMYYLENRCGAIISFEEANYIFWEEMDPNSPYESLAKKVLANPLIGPFERMMGVTLKLIDQYKIDGVIDFAHWGCRHLNNGAQILREKLQKIGVPLLVLDSDCLDERNYSNEQVKTRIESFLEILE